MDLIREILLFAEERCSYADQFNHIPSVRIEIDGVPQEAINFHVRLLREAQFVIMHGGDKNDVYIQAIRWQGYEFLDKIRDGKQWKRIKGILSKTGDFSFETVSRAASSLIAEQLKHLVPSALAVIAVYLVGLFTKPFWK